MNIIEEKYDWMTTLFPRERTTHLILHHMAGSGFTAQDVHRYHREHNGWSGIAYHYYVRKDGSVYRGRPENVKGGHTKDWNGCSIGVCFEGNFENERMSAAQKKAGLALVEDIKGRYPDIVVGVHKEFNATACPGKNFPVDEFKEAGEMSGEQIYEKLQAYLETLPVPDWAAKELEEAVKAGITDGKTPMVLVPRYQAAIMAKRAAKKK